MIFQVDTFTGSSLGDCENFGMSFDPANPRDFSVEVEMEHRGFNGGQLEWGRIRASKEQGGSEVSLMCYIGEKLDGDMKKTYKCTKEGGCEEKLALIASQGTA